MKNKNISMVYESIVLPPSWSPDCYYPSHHLFIYFINGFCLITEPLETNFVFSSESGKRRMIMWWLSQAGSEADDTAIIWSLRCSIDSRGTHTALPLRR